MTVLANIALSDIFQTWVTRTNQLVVLMNNLTDFASNCNVVFANTITVNRNALVVNGVNVGSTLTSAFAQANTDLTLATGAFDKANAAATAADQSGTQANTARIHANAAFAQANLSSGGAAYDQANTARTHANNAYAQANTGSPGAAFDRANSSFSNIAVTGTNSGYSWTSGNLNFKVTGASSNTVKFVAGSGVEIPMDSTNSAILIVSYGYAAANAAATTAGQSFDKGNAAATAADQSGTQANTARIHANSAYAAANTSATANSNVRFYSVGVGTPPSNTQGEIRATNEITSYYSDRRLKTQWNTIYGSLDKVRMLHGVLYKANDLAGSFGYDTERLQVGLYAQDVQCVLPEAVTLAPFDTSYANGVMQSVSGQHYLTIHYERLIPLLVEAIKDLTQKVEALERRLT